jgi:hypothetical protein
MSGVAATRLLAAGRAGGIAPTAWALSRSGMGRAAVVRGLSTFLAALYGVYMLALVLVGAGLRSGLLTGPAPFAPTVVPAAFGASAIAVALATSLLPRDLDRRVRARPVRHERLAGIVASAASAAGAIAAGIGGALALLRGRDPVLIGAVAWWGCDVGVLWACFCERNVPAEITPGRCVPPTRRPCSHSRASASARLAPTTCSVGIDSRLRSDHSLSTPSSSIETCSLVRSIVVI